MNKYYSYIHLDSALVNDIRCNINNVDNNVITNLLQTRLLDVIEPYFEIKSYKLIPLHITTTHNTNIYKNTSSHTMIIGLDDLEASYHSTSIDLYLPIDDENRSDFIALTESKDTSVLYSLYRKYNISCYSTSKILERQEEIINNIKENNLAFIPTNVRTIINGKTILFKSDINFSFDLNYSVFTHYLVVNLELKEDKNNKVKDIIQISPQLDNNLFTTKGIPFQVLKFVGSYNDKKFDYTYTTYWYFDRDIYQVDKKRVANNNKLTLLLEQIYEEIKDRNNIKYREDLIESRVMNYSSAINNELLEYITNFSLSTYFDYNKLNEAYQTINNFVENNKLDFGDKKIEHNQIVMNTWEENGHGMLSYHDEIYDEVTHLDCNVFILFGVYKI